MKEYLEVLNIYLHTIEEESMNERRKKVQEIDIEKCRNEMETNKTWGIFR